VSDFPDFYPHWIANIQCILFASLSFHYESRLDLEYPIYCHFWDFFSSTDDYSLSLYDLCRMIFYKVKNGQYYCSLLKVHSLVA
jgi:hypothetical protein